MLSEERKHLICEYTNQKSAVTVQELMSTVGASEATIRRDLTELDRKGLLVKVHGGAVTLQKQITTDYKVVERESVNREEKIVIARYAASLIESGDLVYLDAGTTTYLLIDYLDNDKCRDTVFVTNAIVHAKKLSAIGCEVFLTGGKVKATTEALIGSECLTSLQKYYFSIGFFGANAVSRKTGITTPDPEEAEIKRTAMLHTQKPYFLCDHDKFDKTSSVRFADFTSGKIITTQSVSAAYKEEESIIVI